MEWWDEVLSRLRKVKRVMSRANPSWKACCPAHDDNDPSMIIFVNERGYLIARCLAQNCTWKAIVRAVGLPVQMWFAPELRQGEMGSMEQPKKIVATYDYHDENGVVLYQKVRFEPKDFASRRLDPETRRWLWGLEGVRLVPFQLHRIVSLIKETIFICEGEKDALTMEAMGYLGTCSPNAANPWPEGMEKYFNRRNVVLVGQDDEPGHKYVTAGAGRLIEQALSIQIIYPQQGGDVADFFEKCQKRIVRFQAAMTRLLDLADKWYRVGGNK